MAPTTPPKALPKSNLQRSNTSGSIGKPASVAPPKEATPPTAGLDNPSFVHPDHEIPERSYVGFENLVIVCCHAIFHPDPSSSNFPLNSPYDEDNWHLAPFQESNTANGKSGEHETFLGHISAGLDALTIGSWAENSLLVFSGGATKTSRTTLSEARSYYHAALALELYHGRPAGGRATDLYDAGRMLLEEHATDSFQNLLFSILLYRQRTGSYPKAIRIVTHSFKTRRFLNLHAPAIHWPSTRIRVQGIDPIMSRAEYESTLASEEKLGYSAWKEDPLGNGVLLGRKRLERGWDEATTQELGDGLEQNVKRLLDGEASQDLPWSEPAVPERETAATIS